MPSLRDMPDLVMNHILDYCDVRSIFSLRKVSHKLLNHIDAVIPSLHLSGIKIEVREGSLLLVLSDDIDIQYGSFSLICHAEPVEKKGCIVECNNVTRFLKGENFMDIFRNDLELLLKFQKTDPETLEKVVLQWCDSGDWNEMGVGHSEEEIKCFEEMEKNSREAMMNPLTTIFEEIVAKQGVSLKARTFETRGVLPKEAKSLLKLLQPGTLKCIKIHDPHFSRVRGNDTRGYKDHIVNLSGIEELDQWKQAEEFYTTRFYISKYDVQMYFQAFLKSSNFQNFNMLIPKKITDLNNRIQRIQESNFWVTQLTEVFGEARITEQERDYDWTRKTKDSDRALRVVVTRLYGSMNEEISEVLFFMIFLTSGSFLSVLTAYSPVHIDFYVSTMTYVYQLLPPSKLNHRITAIHIHWATRAIHLQLSFSQAPNLYFLEYKEDENNPKCSQLVSEKYGETENEMTIEGKDFVTVFYEDIKYIVMNQKLILGTFDINVQKEEEYRKYWNTRNESKQLVPLCQWIQETVEIKGEKIQVALFFMHGNVDQSIVMESCLDRKTVNNITLNVEDDLRKVVELDHWRSEEKKRFEVYVNFYGTIGSEEDVNLVIEAFSRYPFLQDITVIADSLDPSKICEFLKIPFVWDDTRRIKHQIPGDEKIEIRLTEGVDDLEFYRKWESGHRPLFTTFVDGFYPNISRVQGDRSNWMRVFTNTTILEVILDYAQGFGINNLRRTCHPIQDTIDYLKPSPMIDHLYIGLPESNMLTCVIKLGNGIERSVHYDQQENTCVVFMRVNQMKFPGESYQNLFLKHLKENLKFQKAPMKEIHFDYFIMVEAAEFSEFLKLVEEYLKTRNQPIRVKKFIMTTSTQDDLVSVLPYLCSWSLKTIEVKSRYEEKLESGVDKLVVLDQWRQAEELLMREDTITTPLGEIGLEGFQKADVLLSTISSRDVFELKTKLLISSIFQKLKISFNNSTIDGLIYDLLGRPSPYGYYLEYHQGEKNTKIICQRNGRTESELEVKDKGFMEIFYEDLKVILTEHHLFLDFFTINVELEEEYRKYWSTCGVSQNLCDWIRRVTNFKKIQAENLKFVGNVDQAISILNCFQDTKTIKLDLKKKDVKLKILLDSDFWNRNFNKFKLDLVLEEVTEDNLSAVKEAFFRSPAFTNISITTTVLDKTPIYKIFGTSFVVDPIFLNLTTQIPIPPGGDEQLHISVLKMFQMIDFSRVKNGNLVYIPYMPGLPEEESDFLMVADSKKDWLKVFANPLILEGILKYANLFGIHLLRKLCHPIRLCVNLVKPDPQIKSIFISLEDSTTIDFKVTLKNLHVKLIRYEQEGDGCAISVYLVYTQRIAGVDFKKAFLNHLVDNLKNQKSSLEEFRLDFEDYDGSDFLEVFEDTVRNGSIKTEKLITTVQNQSDLLKLFPRLSSLKSISLESSTGKALMLDIDEVSKLEQWRQAEELKLDNIVVSTAVCNMEIVHFKKADIMKLLTIPTFKRLQISFKNSLIDGTFYQLMGAPFTMTIHKSIFYYKIPNDPDFALHILYLSTRKSITFSRVEISVVPANGFEENRVEN
ncbi:hypothetical protein CRE_15672 [Caenorhabditis remanei]|uniref:F-box domain-containing protein n=1 Tax=Caenorhabditis remanei TaxID=31234 RepID=E3N893_CAERE|nr:hypothetical protein CRE_15672 [Caenorhabditis remanei]